MFYVEEFLKFLKEKQYSFYTLKAYRQTIEHLEDYCTCFGMTGIREVPKKMVFAYLATLDGKDRSTKAYCNKISRLVKYFRYLEEEGLIFLSPLRDFYLPDYQSTHHPVIRKAEMERILRTTAGIDPLCIKGKAMIELAYSSALRPRELYGIKIPDIDFEKGLIFIEQSKNRKDRIVPVGKKALEWTERYIREIRPRYIKDKAHGYLFINHKTGENLTVWGIRWAVQETLRRNGLGPIKPYSLRSTAATHLLVNGMNIIHISKLLGHMNVRTTQYYLDLNLMQLQREIRDKHPRERMEKKLVQKEKHHEV